MSTHIDSEIREVLNSPVASNWLKEALGKALERDCVDAANDAEVLIDLLNKRCEEAFKGLVPVLIEVIRHSRPDQCLSAWLQ